MASIVAAQRLDIDPVESLAWLMVAACGWILSWLCQTKPAALPVWAPWNFSWLEFLAAALSLWWFVRGSMAADPSAQPSAWQRGCFLFGMTSLYGVLQTHFDYMAQHMFLLNRLQHLAMHHLGPFLIALAWPGTTLSRGMPTILRRVAHSRMIRVTLRVVQQPVVGSFLFVGLIALWLTPSIHFRAMLDARLYAIMNWSMVLDGLLFWCMVLDPRPRPPARAGFGARAAAALGVMFPQIALGAYIAFNGRILYNYYDLCGRLYPSISGRYDQLAGGIIVWVPAAMMSVVAFLLVLNNLRRHEDTVTATADDEDQASVIRAAAWTGR